MNQADSPDRPTITLLKHIKRPEQCEAIGLLRALEGIRDGRWKPQVDSIRELELSGNSGEANRRKGRLPCLIFAGEFKHASDAGFVRHSGLAVIDIDDLGEADLLRIRSCAREQLWLLALFTSPRGRGLKLVARIGPQDSDGHKRTVEALRTHCAELFAVEIDSGSDVSRKCFVSFDPHLYLNPSAAVWRDDAFDRTEEKSRGGPEGGRDRGCPSLSSSPSPSSMAPPTGPLKDSKFPSRPQLAALIEHGDLIPNRKHHTHWPLWGLARLALKLAQDLGRELRNAETETLFEIWHQLAKGRNPEYVWRDKDEYLLEYCGMLKNAKTPLGEFGLDTAWALAQRITPPAADRFDGSPKVQLLVALCFHLGQQSGGRGTFFLGCRDVAKFLGWGYPHAATMLSGLVATGILEIVVPGTRGINGRACRYRWVGEPASHRIC